MIAYLPPIYPDELVYSWFCRYYVHSGSLTHKMALNDLFCKRSDSLNKEFIGNLNPEALERIEKVMPMQDLIVKHNYTITKSKGVTRFVKKGVNDEIICKTPLVVSGVLIDSESQDVSMELSWLPKKSNKIQKAH